MATNHNVTVASTAETASVRIETCGTWIESDENALILNHLGCVPLQGVFHSDPIPKFFLPATDGPITVDREPRADPAPRARLESQSDSNRFIDAHEMLEHHVEETPIGNGNVSPLIPCTPSRT
jgi:hypothetical protein